MSCDTDIQTTAGSVIAIGPAPATFDLAGYDAVSVEDIGEVTDIGDIGKLFNTATHTPLAGRQVVEKKTSYNLQHPSLTLAIADSNQGQIDAKAALESDDCYTIKITRQDLSVIYFSAQVSGFVVSFTTDAFENGSISLLSQTAPLPKPAP